MNQRSDDMRGAIRNRMLKGAVIAFSARHATMPCVVRDMSQGGARLQVGQGSAIPDTFELIIELDGLEVHCQVAWRKAREVGVSFLETPRISPPKRVQVVSQTGPVAKATLRRIPAGLPAGARAVEPKRASLTGTADGVRPGMSRAITSDHSGSDVPILIAEDDPDDRLLMKDAFAESRFKPPIAFVEDGLELLKYVRGEAPYSHRVYPGLILLDLNMPRMDGRTALVQLKQDPTLKRIPVIALTTSNADDDIHRTYDLGVTAYVSKPGTHRGLIELIESLEPLWSRIVTFAAR
jgi:two-component system response regulator